MPWYIDSDGYKKTISTIPTNVAGAFEGRTGGIVRSRKGRASRLPNGSRRYFGNRDNCVAYVAGSYVDSAPNQ